MSENSTTIGATPEQVFAVLLDPWTYADWVVGCDAIRGVDDDWPASGSRFHHTVGAGPAKIDDVTTLLESHPPHRLVLAASAQPAGVARVEFVLRPVPADGVDGAATEVTIEEHPIEGPAERVPTAIADIGLKLRNGETLRRLRRVVEERAHTT